MSKGLSARQHEIYKLVEERAKRGEATSSVDVISEFFPQRTGDTSFRKSIWRSLRSLERRGQIKVYSDTPGRRERGSQGAIRYTI